jgi:hypothetical protein
MLELDALKKNTMFEEMEKKLENMDKHVDIYKNEIFSDGKRVSKIKSNRFYAPDKCKKAAVFISYLASLYINPLKPNPYNFYLL